MENFVRTGQFYPESLRYYHRELSGFSKSQVRVSPLNQTSATDGQTVIIEIPNNSIVDMNPQLFFTIATASTTGTDLIALPNNIESIIERFQIVVGSQVAVDIPNYRHLFNAMVNATCTVDKYNEREVLQQSSAKVDLVSTTQTAGINSGTFCIKDWLGSLSDDVQYLHTALLPTVQLRITLATASQALSAHRTGNVNLSASGSLSFTLSDITAIFETVEMGDPMYQNALLSRVQDMERPLRVDYRNYFSFLESRSASSGTMRINVSSQSIDRLIVCQVLAGGGQDASTGATTAFGNINAQSKCNRSCSDGITDYHFTIDSVRYPNQQVGQTHTIFEQLGAVRKAYADDWSSGDLLCFVGRNEIAVDGDNDVTSAGVVQFQSIDSYRGATDNNASTWALSARWQNALSLADLSGESDRVMSGYASKGGSSVIQYVYNGNAPSASRNLLLFAECTSSMLVGAGRAVQIVN